MPNVIVNPVQQISVRVNQGNQQTVHSTATFVGASDAAVQANAALALAQAAYNTANTKVSKSGDTMTGNLVFANSATISVVIDGGIFT
jgi:hypothetical protein